MSRNLLFPLLMLSVLLLPAAVDLRADDAPEAQSNSGATESKTQTAESTKTKGDAKTEQATKTKEGANTEAGPKAEDEAKPAKDEKKKEGPKLVSGMSILGNQEAPKSLVIVPWKSSEIGASLGISTMLDDSKRPIDKEVFLRALNYYQIRSGTKP